MEEEKATDSVQELKEGKDASVATEQAHQEETTVAAEAATEVSHDAEEKEQVITQEDPQHNTEPDQPSRVETAGPTDTYTDTSQPGAMHPLVSNCKQLASRSHPLAFVIVCFLQAVWYEGFNKSM